MKVLLIKTSSLGDVFHTLPAIEDAYRHNPEIEFHWVVEEAFAAVPAWHPAVTKVIPMAWRRWRKKIVKKSHRKEMKAFFSQLRSEEYDIVLDAQCLIKSSVICRMAKGPRYGLDKHSAREPLAAKAYQFPQKVAKGQHAIHRVRQLFSQVFNYPVPQKMSYGVDKSRWSKPDITTPYWLFLHGTTWDTKLWPESYWIDLAGLALEQGKSVLLPWGNDEELQRAKRIEQACQQKQQALNGDVFVRVLERMGLNELNAYLAYADAVAGVDTGLSHVAAAMEVPSVAIYGATDSVLTGVLGPKVTVLNSAKDCAPCLSKRCQYQNKGDAWPPCYQSIPAQKVLKILTKTSSD